MSDPAVQATDREGVSEPGLTVGDSLSPDAQSSGAARPGSLTPPVQATAGDERARTAFEEVYLRTRGGSSDEHTFIEQMRDVHEAALDSLVAALSVAERERDEARAALLRNAASVIAAEAAVRERDTLREAIEQAIVLGTVPPHRRGKPATYWASADQTILEVLRAALRASTGSENE